MIFFIPAIDQIFITSFQFVTLGYYLYKPCLQVLAGNSVCRAGGGGFGGGWFGEFESVWKSSYVVATFWRWAGRQVMVEFLGEV